MRALHDKTHEGYRLQQDLSDGYPPFEHMEKPERVEAIKRALKRLGFELSEIHCTAEPELLRTLHDAGYVEFLKELCAEIAEGKELIPGVLHPRGLTKAVPLRQRLGSFTNEIGTPLTRRSFDAALASFALALEGANALSTDSKDLFCLTRPPGHHAGRARFGGYCLFNNAAGAATLLSNNSGATAALLDIDYHIGDGTLEFATDKTPYFSLHADPVTSYPFCAYPQAEHPHAKLIDLAPGTDGGGYLRALSKLTSAINRLDPAYVVVSTGFDALGSDYIQDAPLNIGVDEFAEIGRLVRTINAPKLYLLEGGYSSEHLEECVYNFFTP